MAENNLQILRVFSNNAVLVRQGEEEMVLVGRGVGFSRRAGQFLEPDDQLRRYVSVPENQVRYLDLLSSVDPELLDAVGEAINTVADMESCEFEPSVYLLLTDHLAFAIQRFREGKAIQNPLLAEIKSVFPQDFASAKFVLKAINTKLGVGLPEGEIAFITLHLNAARRGSSVKAPMRRANRVAGLLSYIRENLGISEQQATNYDKLASEIVTLEDRLAAQKLRHNPAQLSIQRDLPTESAIANQVISQLCNAEIAPKKLAGEVSYLAVFLHGWAQDIIMDSPSSA